MSCHSLWTVFEGVFGEGSANLILVPVFPEDHFDSGISSAGVPGKDFSGIGVFGGVTHSS